MSRAKQPSKRKRRSRALPALGAAGLSFSLASGASAAPAANIPTRSADLSHEFILAEEEVSDVSLATFYVFDKENTGTFRYPAYSLSEVAAAAVAAAAVAAAAVVVAAVVVAAVVAVEGAEDAEEEEAAVEAVRALEDARAMGLADAQDA